MGMKGNLRDMAVADLIQHYCQDQKTARLQIHHSNETAVLYFQGGNLVHAALGDQAGEEVIFQLLHWEDGLFNLDANINPPKKTIERNWTSLLLEGARLLDETQIETQKKTDPDQNAQNIYQEVSKMAKLDDVLKEMSGEVTGYVSSALVGMDGINLASHSGSKSADPETISAQMTLLVKLVDSSVEKLNSGVIEDNLTSTENAFLLIRFLAGKQFFLGIAANRKSGNLGNLRLISKLYADRLAKAMPH